MSAVRSAPAEESLSLRKTWLRLLVQPYPLAAVAVITALVIAILGMPDLIPAGSRWFTPILLALPLILWAVIIMIRHRRHDIKPGAIDILLLATVTYFTFRNIRLLVLFYAFYGLGLFYLASEITRSQRFLKNVIFAFAGLAFVAALLGLLELVIFRQNLAANFGIGNNDPRAIFPRVGSTLLQPDYFGGFLVMALPVCGYLGLAGNSRNIRIFGLISTLLCLLSVLFTFAKGGWLITFFMGVLFVILLLRQRDLKKLALIAGLAAAILLSLIFLWQPVSGQTMLRIKSSVRSRTYTWKYAWREIAQNPVFGVGQAQGPIALIDMNALLEKYYHDHSTPAAIDNYYLEYLLEEGAAGFLPFLLFLVLLFYRGARGLFRPGAHRGMLVPVFAGLAALCLDAVTFDALTWWSLFICFWVFAGLLNGLAEGGRAEGAIETVKGTAAAAAEL